MMDAEMQIKPGDGIFGTDIDLTGLDPDVALRLGHFVGTQIRWAESEGYRRAIADLRDEAVRDGLIWPVRAADFLESKITEES